MNCPMPAMDDFDPARTLRAKGLEIPIVALVAKALRGEAELCYQESMDDYLPKPS